MEFQLLEGLKWSMRLFAVLIIILFTSAYVYQLYSGLRGPGKTKRRIWWLKKEARKSYLARDNVHRQYDCGITMASEISREYNKHNARFKELKAELKLIDPNYPEEREL